MQTNRKYFLPTSIEGALSIISEREGNAKVVAGGTDVWVNKFQGNDKPLEIVDISSIAELKNISVQSESIVIGALVTLEEITEHKDLLTIFPDLCEAAKSVGSPVLRKSATLAGNLLVENRCSFYNQTEWWREAVGHCLKCEGDVCIATGGDKNCFSKCVSDTAIMLIALDAKIEVVSPGSAARLISLESIYTGDGVKPRNLTQQDLILRIHIPVVKNTVTYFRKLRHRESLEFSSLTLAVRRCSEGSMRIVLGAVDPKPVVFMTQPDENLVTLAEKIKKKPRAIDNDVFSRKYRKEMIDVFLEEAFKKVKAQ